MPVSKWFNYEVYMTNKLAQLEKTDPAGKWNMPKLFQAFSDAGFKGEDGAFAHFEQSGQYEDVAPNAFFNANEYYRAKAVQATGKTDAELKDFDIAGIKQAIKDSSMNAWSHYEQHGSAEGVNPSNGFDTTAYLNAKLKTLQDSKDGITWTMDMLNQALKDAGLSALEHFMLYGGAAGEPEGLTLEGKIPSQFLVDPKNQVKPDGGAEGKSFSLTTETDIFTGSADNDTFIAGGANTLTAGDQLDGAGGINTLKLYDNNAAKFADASIKNIQIVQNYADSNLDVSGNLDVKEAWAMKVAGKTVTASLDQAIGFGGTGTTETVEFVGTETANDAAVIALSDAGKTTAFTSLTVEDSDTNGNGAVQIEKLTIELSGKNQIGDLVAESAEDIIFTGTGTVDAVLNPTTAVLKSVNAAQNTGGVTLSLTDAQFGSNPILVTGGSGNDSITFTDALAAKATIDLGSGDDVLVLTQGTTPFTAGSTIKGGSGAKDKLVLDTTTTAINATSKTVFSEFEVISLKGTSTYTEGDISGITDYEVQTGATQIFNKLSDGREITVTGNVTAALKLNLADLTDVSREVSVVLDNGATGAAAGVVLAALETDAAVLNVNSLGMVNATHNKLTLDGASTGSLKYVANVNIEGDQAFDLVTGASDVLTRVDGHTATGALNIDASGSKVAMTILGGTKGDTIAATDEAKSTITGGGGADTITLGSTAADNKGDVLKLVAQSDSTISAYDSVTNFCAASANADKIDLTAFGFTGTQAAVSATAAKATVTNGVITITDANAAGFFKDSGVDKAVAVFADTTTAAYVFIDINKDGNWDAASDSVVKLVGDYSSDKIVDGNFDFS